MSKYEQTTSYLELESREILSALKPAPWAVESQRQRQRDERIENVLVFSLKARSAKPSRTVRSRTLLIPAFAAAAAGLLWLSPPSPEEQPDAANFVTVTGSVTLDGVQGETTLDSGQGSSAQIALPFAGDVHAAEAATLTLVDGVHIHMAAHTKVGVAGLSEPAQRRLSLQGGSVSCRVPKLVAAETFAVATPEATVVVHGTVFSVTRNSSKALTCVQVEEGRVEVRHGAGRSFLTDGQSWGCDKSEENTEESLEQVDAPEPEPKLNKPATASGRDAQLRESSTLAGQAAALQRALSAERAGRYDEARRELRKLLRTYPDSPLAPEINDGLTRLKNR